MMHGDLGEHEFPLTELICALTAELQEARRQAECLREPDPADDGIRTQELQVVGASIELMVGFERTGEGDIGFKVFGIGANAKAGQVRQNATKMIVSLMPPEKS